MPSNLTKVKSSAILADCSALSAAERAATSAAILACNEASAAILADSSADTAF